MPSYVAQVIETIQDAGVTLAGISPPSVPATVPTTFPFVTVTQIFSKEHEHLGGLSGLIRVIIQVNTHDKQYERAWTTREAIKTALFAAFGTRINHNQDNEVFNPSNSTHQLVVRLFIWFEKP
jgi:hypothetical protein